MGEYVCDGTEFSCPFCTSKLKLKVTSSPAKSQGKPIANMSNCFFPPPGGQCTVVPSAPVPCTPAAQPVDPGQSPLKVGGPPALGAGCKFQCAKGGLLTVSSAGQSKFKHDVGGAGAAAAAVAGTIADLAGKKKKDEEEEKEKKENKATAEKIANGHAYEKHKLTRGEYPGAMRTRKQFQDHIEKTMNNPATPTKKLAGNRTAYWDKEYGSIIIKNPKSKDLGTMFQPKAGKEYFDKLR